MRAKALLPAALLLVASADLAVAVVPRLTRHEEAIARAGAELRAAGHRTPDYSRIDADFTAALAAVPRDTHMTVWATRLQLEAAQSAAGRGDRAGAEAAVARSVAHLDRAAAAGVRDASLVRTRAQANEFAADLLGEPSRRERALVAWREVLTLSPYSLPDHLHLADALWRLGRLDEARDVYRRCLWLSDQAYLDEAKQLTPEQRSLADERLSDTPHVAATRGA